MKKITFFVGVLLITTVLQAHTQEIYKEKDTEGRVIFTDQPSDSAQPVDIEPVNTTPAIKPRALPSEPKPAAPLYKSLIITAPANDSIIPNGPGNFSAACQLSPALRAGHQFQLLLNGQSYATAINCRFELTAIPRGQHQLLVQVIDKEQRPVIASNPVSVFVYRPSKK